MYAHVSPGYDVQSASTPDGVLYITGAPRYNHTGRVVIYRLNETNNIAVSQILRGEQVRLFQCLGSFLSDLSEKLKDDASGFCAYSELTGCLMLYSLTYFK